jgi:tRNA (cmo5U34)-methyltransferase
MKIMGKDEVFRDEIEKASDFKFGENVAKVFDDMVNRSVPFYGDSKDDGRAGS